MKMPQSSRAAKDGPEAEAEAEVESKQSKAERSEKHSECLRTQLSANRKKSTAR